MGGGGALEGVEKQSRCSQPPSTAAEGDLLRAPELGANTPLGALSTITESVPGYCVCVQEPAS
jgi:serine acetyltransferase